MGDAGARYAALLVPWECAGAPYGGSVHPWGYAHAPYGAIGDSCREAIVP